VALIVLFALGGCAGHAQPLPTPRFGPVYLVGHIGDPLVAATVRRVQAQRKGARITGAEIRGYLVDWVLETSDSLMIDEVAVMKDGTIYNFSRRVPGTTREPPFERPSAYFGSPAARLSPEPAREARARLAALAAAGAIERKTDAPMAKSNPLVFDYLVEVHRADGSVVDVWVTPDVAANGFDYDAVLSRRR
jgi:hypothetical protein